MKLRDYDKPLIHRLLEFNPFPLLLTPPQIIQVAPISNFGKFPGREARGPNPPVELVQGWNCDNLGYEIERYTIKVIRSLTHRGKTQRNHHNVSIDWLGENFEWLS